MIRISPNLKDTKNLEGYIGACLDDDKNTDFKEIFKESAGVMDKMEVFYICLLYTSDAAEDSLRVDLGPCAFIH